MDFFEWTKIIVALTIAIVTILVIRVTGELTFFEEPAKDPAYKVADVDEAEMNMSQVQRSWPLTGVDRREKSRMRNFMDDIEDAPPPQTASAGGNQRPAPAPEPDIATLLTSADADRGRRSIAVCTACHTFVEGGTNGVGPNLWNILGRTVASVDGFNYSSAFRGQDGTWTYERLNAFLKSPSESIPGNRMAFLGVRRGSERANIIAYLRSLSESPLPLPEPTPETAIGE